MKKTLKAALSILLVLTLLATLPLTAMAEEPEAQPTPVADNTSANNNPTVDSGEIMSQNTGTVTSNAGTITDNGEPKADDTKSNPTSGTVEKNQNDGKIENNYGTVVENGDTSGASQIINNYGTVNTNSSGNQGKDRKAGIVTNYGLVETNAQYSIVGTNAEGGIVQTNNGWVGYNNYDDGARVEGVGNAGEVTDNYGLVFNDGGTVVNNHAQGADGCPAIVDNYSGTVVNNYGEVYGYDEANAKVTNNYGSVEGGTVETNDVGGWVEDSATGHYEGDWKWVPDELLNSTVITNYGTHVKYADVQDYEKRNEGGGTYYFGVHFEDKDEKVYLGSYEYTNEVTIDALNTYAKEKGYKITDIQEVKDYSWQKKDFVDHNEAAPQNGDSPEQTPGTTGLTSFRISAPTRLKLLWEKIASIFTPAPEAAPSNEPEAKPVKAAAIPTTVKAEDVKVGTTVRAKGQTFKVIEMDDGSMTIVTMGKLSKKDMEDLTAFLAKYFTPEQIELLLGDPELISEELAAQLFGGNTGHIVFKAAKNLFA